MMRTLLLLLLSFSLCSITLAQEYEKIFSFHSDIRIQADGSVLVTEKIGVVALGINIRNGIYRDIPLNFEVPEKVRRQRLKIKSVKRNNKPERFKTELNKGRIRIYMGSESSPLTKGRYLYELTYTLDRTAYCNDTICQVMWNVNGNHWNFEVDTLTATITTPDNTEILSFDGWSGQQGIAVEKDFTSASITTGKRVFRTSKLAPGSNLTVLVTYSPSVMTEASSFTRLLYTYRDHALYFWAILGVLISFFINFRLWAKHGKDPRKGTIIPQFYPPEDWSPAEVSFLMNEAKTDKNMFTAQLLQLAVKGHIKIEKEDPESKKDAFLISYTSKSTKKTKLTILEEGFLKKLLGIEKSIVIEKKYNPNVLKAQKYLSTEIEKSQAGLYFNKNLKFIPLQYIVPLISVIGMAYVLKRYDGPGWIIFVSILIFLVMNVIFLRLFYQPTKEGRKMLDHILGLERYIKYADELRINAINKPDMNFDHYEKNLPYAVAFGKADEWGKKFRPQDVQAQYESSNYFIKGSSFNSLSQLSALSVASTAASISPSSGSSGGGFSGGGGSSGGGAGGGGGGGW